MQANTSFQTYYGYHYEPSLANVALLPSSEPVPAPMNMPPFAFPLGQPITHPPFFESKNGHWHPGPWLNHALPAPMRLAPEESNHLARPGPGVMRRLQRVKRLSVEERYQQLKDDDYVLGFNAVEVKCSGCEGVIKLDRRDGAKYYLGLWHKHKRSCRGVKEKMVRYITSNAICLPIFSLLDRQAT